MLLDKDSRWVRLILRIYFNVVFILVALVGDRCVVYSAKLHLLKTQNVNVMRLTSWLKSWDPIIVLVRTGRLPASWLGGLMVICAALAFVSDVSVSALVRSVQVPDRCPFDTGLVSGTRPPLSVIPVNGSPYTVVLNAQLNSIANGGTQGIYFKVNEDRNFQAQDEDIAGGWVCTDLNQDQIYQLGTTEDSIINDLVSRDLLFNTEPHSESSTSDDSFNHFVVVTSSQADGANEPFDIRASIQQEADTDSQKTMISYDCSMNAPVLEWVLANASSQAILKEWILTFQGGMYNGSGTTAASDADVRLELILNSMVMIGAGGNYLLSSAPLGSTQGCLTQQTLIPNAMVAIFAIITFVFIALPLYLTFVFVKYHRASSSERSRLSNTPNGLVDWTVEAARASLGASDDDVSVQKVKATSLKQWQYGFPYGHDGQPRLFRRGQESSPSHITEQSIGLMGMRRDGVDRSNGHVRSAVGSRQV